ncbi:hypothetical protein SAMN04487996_10232 [Dyadobacter soli]|uniref:Uncharacterized protein n=1 Tax=Dyadobacter soli TaxID=659014 RepID=A0A1G6X2L4_9BACT|nr:hypothetical protein [Dyadobacter soli]SDD71525.1 hypothetical protein SAMN04487996_10232 [Dyadobacter soli]
MHLQKTRKRIPVNKADSTVTAVASFYSTLFLQLPESGFKGIVSVCAPVFGYITFIVWKVLHAQLRLVYYAYGNKKCIAELEVAKAKPGVCCEDVQEIEKRIKILRNAMYERRMDVFEGIW